MTTFDILCQLALFHLKGLGVSSQLQLREVFGSAQGIIEADRTLLLKAGVKRATLEVFNQFCKNPELSSLWPQIERDLEWQQHPNQHILAIGGKYYPALLGHISTPPPVLFVKGDLSLLESPQLAIIGSRQPSVDGRDNAWRFSRSLARSGLTITSGLAAGIDGAAHEGALDQGGKTLAVVGTGIDRVYPSRHKALFETIANKGAVVSEFPLGSAPQVSHFPRRNRIIAGLSLGVLVVEAGIKSGSLITAHQALDAGREVYAIPGSIRNPMTKGCHQLLKEGAKLVECSDDIFEELSALFAFHQHVQHCSPKKEVAPEKRPDLSSELLDAMGFDIISIDALVERTCESVTMLSQKLMLMELEGYVRSVPGGYQRISS